jgi:hypothetical protein
MLHSVLLSFNNIQSYPFTFLCLFLQDGISFCHFRVHFHRRLYGVAASVLETFGLSELRFPVVGHQHLRSILRPKDFVQEVPFIVGVDAPVKELFVVVLGPVDVLPFVRYQDKRGIDVALPGMVLAIVVRAQIKLIEPVFAPPNFFFLFLNRQSCLIGEINILVEIQNVPALHELAGWNVGDAQYCWCQVHIQGPGVAHGPSPFPG